jgi:hypothetical protein
LGDGMGDASGQFFKVLDLGNHVGQSAGFHKF